MRREQNYRAHDCIGAGCTDQALCEACYAALPFPPPSKPAKRLRGRPRALTTRGSYHDMSRRQREHHRQWLVELIGSDPKWDIKIASLSLLQYGMKLVQGGNVIHVLDDDRFIRRRVSGSVWDGRKLIWRAPKVIDWPHKLGKFRKGPKVRCAHRTWESAGQQKACSRPPAMARGHDEAAADALLATIGHLATPATKRAHSFLTAAISVADAAMRDQDQALDTPVFWKPWWHSVYFRGGLVPRTGIPRCIGFVSANEWPGSEIDLDLSELSTGDAWHAMIGGSLFADDPYEDDPAAERKVDVKTFLYRPGTALLQRPDVSRDEPFRAAARLWNWERNNHHRAQTRVKFPFSFPWSEFYKHGPCRPPSDVVAPVGRAGKCCRWTLGGRRSDPKQSCPIECWQRANRGQK
jgi:hypothetical protein